MREVRYIISWIIVMALICAGQYFLIDRRYISIRKPVKYIKLTKNLVIEGVQIPIDDSWTRQQIITLEKGTKIYFTNSQ